MLDTVVMYGDDVCCSVVFGTLVGVFVFSVMWSELLMTSAISCPLWSSVYECQRVECAFTSPVRTECGMFMMYCMQCCMSVSRPGYVVKLRPDLGMSLNCAPTWVCRKNASRPGYVVKQCPRIVMNKIFDWH